MQRSSVCYIIYYVVITHNRSIAEIKKEAQEQSHPIKAEALLKLVYVSTTVFQTADSTHRTCSCG